MLASVLAFSGLGLHLYWHVRMPPLDATIYAALLVGLFYCCVAYQVSRFGAARRFLAHRAFTATDLDPLLTPDAPSIAVLVPSYREEPRVLVATLLSAALARYSNRRIVLLVDDPPGDVASVRQTLEAVDDVKALLREPMQLLRDERAGWLARRDAGADLDAEAKRLGRAYAQASATVHGWVLRFEAEITAEFAHVDRFFIERVLRDLEKALAVKAEAVVRQALSVEAIDHEFYKLATLFCDDITSFQRKRYANLSSAPNKAMNLNAYIGLLGGAFRVKQSRDGRELVAAEGAEAEFSFPAADYVLTLDADSVIVGSYMLQLAEVLARHPRAAVAQTPYRAFPDSAEAVERIAGATTDIQYLIHQGATFFNASYWVGANALIRVEALRDIRREQFDGEKMVPVFIQDETVIEDTGSTIDLLRAGWYVHNYFEPLAYSATPGDFGSLAIQRKRWSNGGLIIFPMLLRQYLGSPGRLRRLPELLVRSHYLLSPLIGNLAVFLLMVWHGQDGRALVWTPLVMIPYFGLYAIDLKRLGYRKRDLIAVCSLNLMLLPIGFAGIFASIRQMVTGRKGSFSRTPKVANRTFVPPYAFLFSVAMLGLMIVYVVQGLAVHGYLGTIIPMINVGLYSYGLHRFVGIRNGFDDVGLALENRYGAPAARLRRFVQATSAALQTRPGRAFAAAILAAFFVVSPWHPGDTLSGGDRFRGQPPASGAALAEPVNFSDVVARHTAGSLAAGSEVSGLPDRFRELRFPAELGGRSSELLQPLWNAGATSAPHAVEAILPARPGPALRPTAAGSLRSPVPATRDVAAATEGRGVGIAAAYRPVIADLSQEASPK